MANLDPARMMEDLDDETRGRLWVIEHFRVLPTDDRFLRLTDAQISILTNYWLHTASDDEIKKAYWTERAQAQRAVAPEAEALAELGYGPDEIAAIKAEMKHV